MKSRSLSAIALAGLVLSGCSKRQPEAPPAPPPEPPPRRAASSGTEPEWAPTPVSPPAAPRVGSNQGAVVVVSNALSLAEAGKKKLSVLDITPLQMGSPAIPPAEAARRLEGFEQRYGATADLDQRQDLLDEIKKLAIPAVTETYLRLFKLELNDDLKLNLLDSVSGSGGTFDEKMEVLKEGLAATQSVPVRQAAIDALVDLADTRVLASLKGLLDDVKPEVRDYAREIYAIMTTPPK